MAIASDLQQNVDDDDHEGVEEVEQEPHLHRLDGGRAGQRGGDREVDGGQHHHARDVDCDDQVILVLHNDEGGCLVDNVHQEGW